MFPSLLSLFIVLSFTGLLFSSSDIWDYLELDDPSTSNDPTGDGLPLARPLQQALEEGLPSPISVDDFLIADVPLVAPLGHPSPSVDIRGHHPPMASVPPAEDVFSDSDLLVGKSGAGGQRQLPSGIVERLLCVSFFFFFFFFVTLFPVYHYISFVFRWSHSNSSGQGCFGGGGTLLLFLSLLNSTGI